MLPLMLNFPKVGVAELAQNRGRASVPAGPGQRRIAVRILGVEERSRAEKLLNRFLGSERGRSMQGHLAPGARIPHEAMGFNARLRLAVRICSMRDR
jgi:hypothetical protein